MHGTKHRITLGLLLLAACGEGDLCGDFVEVDGRCVCPDDLVPSDDGSTCVAPEGAIDAGIDASTSSDAGTDACAAAPEVCNHIDDDCDGTIDEDPTECSFPNATTVCDTGMCGMGECSVGFADCTEEAGCEVRLADDRNHCGSCGSACGVGEMCSSSTCLSPEIARVGQMDVPTGALVAAGGGRVASANHFGDTFDFQGERFEASGASTALMFFTTDLEFEWGRAIAETTPQALDMDRLGNVVVGGNLHGVISVDGNITREVGGSSDGWAASFDPSGALRWLFQYRSEVFEQVRDVFVDDSGSTYVLLSGRTAGRLDVRQIDASTLQSVEDAGCMTVVKHRPTGGVEWVRSYDWCDGPEGLLANERGGVVVYGTLEGETGNATLGADVYSPPPDFYFSLMHVELDEDGNYVTGRQFPCTRGDAFFRDGVRFRDGYVLSGFCDGGEVDLGGGPLGGGILAFFGPGVELRWSHGIGESVDSVRALNDSTLVAGGRFRSQFDFGGESLRTEGLADVFVVSVDGEGSYRQGVFMGGLGEEAFSGLDLMSEPGAVLASLRISDTLRLDGETFVPSFGARLFVEVAFD